MPKRIIVNCPHCAGFEPSSRPLCKCEDGYIVVTVPGTNVRKNRAKQCADCGELGESVGHQTCQYPRDHR